MFPSPAKFAKFASAAVFGLAVVVTAPSASAAIVTGNWDPDLPPVFGNLGWSATINVDVSDNCVRSDGSTPFTFNVSLFGRTFGCNGSSPVALAPFRILSAQIGIYDLTTSRIVDILTLDPTSFTPLFLQLGPGSSIDYLFSSTDSNPVGTRTPGSFNPDYLFDPDYVSARFRLDLPGAAPNILYQLNGPNGSTGFVAGTAPVTETSFRLTENVPGATVVANTALVLGQLVFSVPEPGSLALVGLALAAAGLGTARRTRRQSHQSR